MDIFEFRHLKLPHEMYAVEELQRTVWRSSETDIVPKDMLLSIAHHGGVLIGAFERQQLVGFVCSFPALKQPNQNGALFGHYSYMLGVHPNFRSRRLGYALKMAQRQSVLEQGLEWITWTYDPLLSRNAHLNIRLLGAVCSTYLPEYYGQMRDGLNAGLPSDRFQVDWWLRSQRVRMRSQVKHDTLPGLVELLSKGAHILNPAEFYSGWAQPGAEAVGAVEYPSKAALLLEIPASFPALKAADSGLALAWRTHTRDWFQHLFTNGYQVTDFIHQPGDLARSYYVLSLRGLQDEN